MSPGKLFLGRPLHQTTLCLGDQMPCYSTTHTQSFCGRRVDGQPLVFYLRDPCYPSQHHGCLDHGHVSGDVSSSSPSSSSHSKDVHSPKVVTPHYVLHGLRSRNWTRSREGLAMKEVTNPPEDTAYRSSYRSDHCTAETRGRDERTSGRPTCWHRHDILTGEKKAPGVPWDPRRKPLESEISAARPWESDCTALRLY